MILFLLAAGLVAAAAVCLVIVLLLVRRRRSAVGSVFVCGGVDMDTGNIGTGTSDFHKELYPTILAKDAPPAQSTQWEILLRDLHRGSNFQASFRTSLTLGRGTAGEFNNGILGIGLYSTVSHQQLLLRAENNALMVYNVSQKVMALCNHTPLYQPAVLKAGDVLQAGGAKVQILQIRCLHV